MQLLSLLLCCLVAPSVGKLVTKDEDLVPAIEFMENFIGDYEFVSQRNISMPWKRTIRRIEEDGGIGDSPFICPGAKEGFPVSLTPKSNYLRKKGVKVFSAGFMEIEMRANVRVQNLTQWQTTESEAACWFYLGSIDYCIYTLQDFEARWSGVGKFVEEDTFGLEKTYQMRTNGEMNLWLKAIMGMYMQMDWVLTPATDSLVITYVMSKIGLLPGSGPNFKATFECKYKRTSPVPPEPEEAKEKEGEEGETMVEASWPVEPELDVMFS